MIQATYYRSLHRVTVTGHAGAAENGKDLVCASASILAYTLAANVANMADAGQVRQPIIENSEGNTVISCNPRHNLKYSVTLVFDAIFAGFQLLAHDYPEFVTTEIRP